MFKFSKESDYAIQFLLRLSSLHDGHVLSLRDFSEESSISFLFLQRIARKLKQAGFVASTKGPTGGYALRMPYEDITLKDVLEAIGDTSLAVAPCLDEKKECDVESNCSIKHGVQDVQKKMLSVLENTSITHFSV